MKNEPPRWMTPQQAFTWFMLVVTLHAIFKLFFFSYPYDQEFLRIFR